MIPQFAKAEGLSGEVIRTATEVHPVDGMSRLVWHAAMMRLTEANEGNEE